MGEIKGTYKLVAESLVLNQAISQQEFAIDVPAGAKIYSRIIENLYSRPPVSNLPLETITTTYYAVEHGTISLAQGGYDLDKMRWLQKGKISPAASVPPTGGVRGWMRWLLTSIVIIMIFAAIFHMIYRKWQQN